MPRAASGFLTMATFASIALACAGEQTQAPVAQLPAPETVFVQQPVPPPPAPPPLEVGTRSIAFDALGDTARLALPEGASCVAGSEEIANVDETGLVRAASNGVTHLRCWLAERNATVKIVVDQKLARVSVVADEGLAMRRSGDSLQLNLARVDRLGTPVTAVRPAWASLTPEVVRVDPVSGVAIGLADSGSARIVGMADSFADTVTVEIGVKSSTSQLLSNTGRTSLSRARTLSRANAQRNSAQRAALSAGPGGVVNQSATNAPTTQQQNPTGIGARGPVPADSLFRDPQTGDLAGPARSIVPALTAGFAEYRTLPSGGGLEKTSGAIYGGELTLATRGLLSFRFSFMTGTLTKDTSTVIRDRKLMSGAVDAGIALAPWLNLTAGVEARRFEDVVVQRWIMVRAGGEANVSLGGGALRGIARLQLVPLISIASNAPVTSPSFGLASALGLGFENRRVSASLLYDIERYSFPSASGRKEQFGAILFRFGYKFGW